MSLRGLEALLTNNIDTGVNENLLMARSPVTHVTTLVVNVALPPPKLWYTGCALRSFCAWVLGTLLTPLIRYSN